MRIRLRNEKGMRTISIPDWLVLGKLVFSGRLEFGGKGFRLTGLNRKRMAKILAEVRRIARKKGGWVLVEVNGADGDLVTIEV